MNPAIVVITYNRPQSFQRLLSSIGNAKYNNAKDIPLCICIDYQNSEENREILEIANSFEWLYGEKIIIHQSKNLGLKKHVLTSGDLTKKFDSIIMLEDDLYVSPFFYSYASEALRFYQNENRIGGISLYSYDKTQSIEFPFRPIKSQGDVYFIQVPSSWGQAWTQKQWQDFRLWLSQNEKPAEDIQIPLAVQNWSKNSWKKDFTLFLVAEKKYFVSPYVSLTTNFGEGGVHTKRNSLRLQTPLQIVEIAYKFPLFEETLIKYDVFFELEPAFFKKHLPYLNDIVFTVDLKGEKNLYKYKVEHAITSQTTGMTLKSFGLNLKPIELNVLLENEGHHFYFVKLSPNKDRLKSKTPKGLITQMSNRDVFDYFFNAIKSVDIVKHSLFVIRDGLKRKLRLFR